MTNILLKLSSIVFGFINSKNDKTLIGIKILILCRDGPGVRSEKSETRLQPQPLSFPAAPGRLSLSVRIPDPVGPPPYRSDAPHFYVGNNKLTFELL